MLSTLAVPAPADRDDIQPGAKTGPLRIVAADVGHPRAVCSTQFLDDLCPGPRSTRFRGDSGSTDRFGNESSDWSGVPSISPDDRYVVFRSNAANLVQNDTNGQGDVFIAHGPATLLVDGFESGDLSRWSSATP